MRSREFTSAIVHISDIECGERNYAHDPARPYAYDDAAEELIRDLHKELIEDRKFAPDDIGLVITGDLSHKGHPPELRKASEVVSRIQAVMGISKGRTAIVPGNHDVNRDACKRAFDRYDPRPNPKEEIDRQRAYLEPAKLADFKDEISQKVSVTEFQGPGNILVFSDFVTLGVALIGFDTTYPCTFLEKDNCGILPQPQVLKAGLALKALLAKRHRLVPIAVMHHCPIALARRDENDESYLKNGPDALRWLREGGFSVCLCGHEHKVIAVTDEYEGIRVLATGSYGLSDFHLRKRYGQNQSNKYQILLISPERKSQVLLRTLSPAGTSEGKWGPDTGGRAKDGVLDGIKFRRPQLPDIQMDEVRKYASIRKSDPIPCGENRWVVALCIDAPQYVLDAINCVKFHVDGTPRWAENRSTNFLTDVLTSSQSCDMIFAEVETESDTFVLTC